MTRKLAIGGGIAALTLALSATVWAASPALQNAADTWTGQYQGAFIEGGRGSVSIAQPDAKGRRKIEMAVTTPSGCSGEVSGSGVATGSRLIFTQPNYDDGLCRITLDKTGNRLAVSEDGCMSMHGAECAFSGTATRKGDATAGASAAPTGAGWTIDTDSRSPRTAAGVRANEEPRLFLQYQCWSRGALRAHGLSVGVGDSMAFGTNGTSPGFSEYFGRIPSLTVQIVAPGGAVRTLALKRNFQPGVDAGFMVEITPALLPAMKNATQFRMTFKGRVLTFSGSGATRAITGTRCQEITD